jgi:hypothetical protein
MRSTLLTVCFFSLLLATTYGQTKPTTPPKQLIDAGFAIGSSQGSASAAYNYIWNLGKKGKFFVGTGVRYTNYFGKNKDFTSAPPSLAENAAKTDTIVAPSPSLNAINLMINLGYNFTPQFSAGFNIDALGFSFGPTGSPKYRGVITSAKPTGGNFLLIGNNDKGTLNSHFYLRYLFNERLGVSAAYEFLFTELTTTTKIQTTPEQNDRFRNKASNIYIGITYRIK